MQWYRATLASIKAIPNLIIMPSDKGGETVTLHAQQYKDMCMKHLDDRNTYQHLDQPPDFISIWENLSAILRKHHHGDSKSAIRKYLFQLAGHEDLRAAGFYCLIKLHKNPVVGRPIASSINTVTLHASKYLDHMLQPYLQFIPSYLQSTQQLILDLHGQGFPVNSVLVSADIEALYPNIPIKEGLLALRAQLELHGMKPTQLNFLLDLAEFVLTNNYITFEDEYYLQKSGTAMGTPFAVVFANLFLAHLEHELRMDPNLSSYPDFFRRYIDDLFLVFSGRADAETWLTAYQAQYPTINLTFTISTLEVHFLDLRIFMGDNFKDPLKRHLDTELYASPTHKFLYLPPWSHHPRHTFPAFILAERRRIRLHCSLDTDCTRHDRIFYDRLRNRGYNDRLLAPIFRPTISRQAQLEKAEVAIQEYRERKLAQLNPLVIPSQFINPLVFKVTYSSLTRLIPLRKILNLPQDLVNDEDSPWIFTNRCPIICFKRNPNSGEILMHRTTYLDEDRNDSENSTCPLGMGTQPPIPFGYGGGFAPPTTAKPPEVSNSRWSALLTMGASNF